MTTSPVMDWLSLGLPLALLCDLADPQGPPSTAICAAERPPDDPVWREAAARDERRRERRRAIS